METITKSLSWDMTVHRCLVRKLRWTLEDHYSIPRISLLKHHMLSGNNARVQVQSKESERWCCCWLSIHRNWLCQRYKLMEPFSEPHFSHLQNEDDYPHTFKAKAKITWPILSCPFRKETCQHENKHSSSFINLVKTIPHNLVSNSCLCVHVCT